MIEQISESDYQYICKVVYEYSRINLGNDKRELVMSRLGKRLRAHNLESYSAYCRLLRSAQGADEITHLVDVISTNHTHFFREIKHFDFMREVALPDLHSRGDAKKKFKLWSAASSSGEEPYSLAILLAEFFLKHPDWEWTIDATDISTRILEKAQQGIYSIDRLSEIRPDMIKRYFQKGTDQWEGYYRVKEELRNRVHFSHINLLQPHYHFAEKFHVVFCRNVMIYFDRPTQEQLVNQIFEHMHPHGYLMIGHSESLTNIKHHFKFIKPAIYQKA
jgi:chemotaxis protein methyltransferase CheR